MPVIEVMYGMDEVEVDDALMKIGGRIRKRHVMNV